MCFVRIGDRLFGASRYRLAQKIPESTPLPMPFSGDFNNPLPDEPLKWSTFQRVCRLSCEQGPIRLHANRV